ncbi:MAG: pyruvate carboxylase subunit B [Spirochaetaceae bacterium]
MKLDKHGVLNMTQMNYEGDRPKAMNPVKVQDVSFRDGHQSIFATRGRTEDMIPVAEMMDEIGFHSLEMWGGATFDVMHRFLNEDPWSRIKTLREHAPKTPFSMLLRGQNLVGYRNYPDDVVDTFIHRAAENGIDIFRMFDALHDFRNFETAAKAIKDSGKHFQGTLCYTLTELRLGGDIYNMDFYLKKAQDLVDMGADSICIKDMAGLLAPYDAYNLVKALKEQSDTPIHLHSHFTSGMADLTLLKAIEAGVDVVDTCMAPYAYRTSHPAIEPLVVTLMGTDRDTGLDIKKLAAISKKMEEYTPKYMHLMDNTKLAITDTDVILHQTPGGMLSNLVNQLKAMGEIDKLDKVFEMLPIVRKKLGQIPLVTPTSQIVGTQTVNNVLFDKDGEEFTQITEQVKDLCYGLYGKTELPIDAVVQKKALKGYPRGEEPITCRPADILEPEMETVKEAFAEVTKDLDDEVLCALYPITGKRFLKWKHGIEDAPDEVRPKTLEEVEMERELIAKAVSGELKEKGDAEAPSNARSFDVYVEGEHFSVQVAVPRTGGSANKSVKKKKESVVADPKSIVAPIPGMIVEFKKQVGDEVKKGDVVVVLEAMKMMNNLEAAIDGVIKAIHFDTADSVAKGDVLVTID